MWQGWGMAVISELVPGRTYPVRIRAVDGPGDWLLDEAGVAESPGSHPGEAPAPFVLEVFEHGAPMPRRQMQGISAAGQASVSRLPVVPAPDLVALKALLARPASGPHPMAGLRCESCDTGPFELHRDDCPVLD